MILSKCAIFGSKKPKFIKEQEAKGFLSNLGIRTPFSKIPILRDVLFWVQTCKRRVYKNNLIDLSKVWKKYEKN